jgi:uncharacterized protein (DUF433 family)
MPSATHQELRPTRQEVGGGVYELGDLRAYLALSGTRRDSDQALPWLRAILDPVRHTPRVADYSFSDLISLFVVRELLKKGVTPKTIRDAEGYLRLKWKTDRPFVTDEIQTDGRTVFVDDEVIAGQIESANQQGQQVMREVVSDRLAKVRYHEGTAESWSPAARVLVDPRVQFGEPVIVGTRVPTESVAAVADRQGPAAAASHLAIPLDDVHAAVRFEKRLAHVRA